MRLNKDLREFVELLNSKGVEYLIVGASAVAWHGYPRFTADIDFFVRSSDANAATLLAAIEDFGFSSLQIALEDLNQPCKVVQLGMEPNRIDLITSIAGVAFDEAWARRVAGFIDGIPVSYICLEDLIIVM
jgi:predicted nucleotidyltransferase